MIRASSSSVPATFAGNCHCEALGFRYRTELASAAWSVRACQCGFCRMHAALSTSDPEGSLEFSERTVGTLQRYRFGLRTADFLLCRVCGVYLGAVLRTGRGQFGIINVRALAAIPSDLAAPVAADYSAENTVLRIARREQRWTPVTRAD